MLKTWSVCLSNHNNGRVFRVVAHSPGSSHFFSTSTLCNTLPFLEKSHPPKSKRPPAATPQATSEYQKFNKRIIHPILTSDVELLLKVHPVWPGLV
jgi:hypothetical protein